MADEARALPAPDGEAPLEELSRDHLSVFLYTTFTPEELLELVRKLGITARGFRPEHLSDVERADLVADEVRAAKARRRIVMAELRAILGAPALSNVSLTPEVAAEIAQASIEEVGMARFLWRVLADPDRAVRRAAVPALDRLFQGYYGGAAPGEPLPPGEAPPAPGAPAAAPKESTAIRAAKREAERAARERDRAVAQAEKLREQLRDARAEVAGATRELGEARRTSTRAEAEASRLRAALEKAREKASAAEVSRLARELREAQHRAEVAEARLAERERITPAPQSAPAAPAPPPLPATSGPAEEIEEAPSTWLLPVFTREFYDSLDGWDRRIQRAAFKQANLLAQDHRHPSLRALPLEGLPNLYRVRVATDVRLLYRRGEGNTVEILSLIDREDLDRYIKQAKERA